MTDDQHPKYNHYIVLGGTGLVGSAFVRVAKKRGHVVTAPTHKELDLTDREAVQKFFRSQDSLRHNIRGWGPDRTHVIIAAAKCGGILDNMANSYDYLVQNIRIQDAIIDGLKCQFAQHLGGIDKKTNVMFLGSSCIYPTTARQPFSEESLLMGPFEATNESYAIAKVAGIKQANALRKLTGLSIFTANPCNVYGPNDKFNQAGHVVGSLIHKFYYAQKYDVPTVEIGGLGARREFIFVDDLADICFALLEEEDVASRMPEGIINVGPGTDFTIRELAETIKKIANYDGEIVFDETMPVGMGSKLMDNSLLDKIIIVPDFTSLEDGLKTTYEWYKMKKYMGEL